MTKRINIPGRVHSVEKGNIVAGANEIYDDDKKKKQSVINQEVDNAIGTDEDEGTIKGRIKHLEEEVGNGGSVDERIVNAKNDILGNAATDYNTLGKCEDKIQENAEDIDEIEALIPSLATPSNQLTDKRFVNSSIATNTATFRGTSAAGLTEQAFLEWANALIKDNNDYVFWNTVDSDGNTLFKKYKYNGTQWLYEYTLNNSSFTAAQWASIESGMTEALKDKLVGLPTGTEISQQINEEATARANADSAINATIGTDHTSGTIKGRIKVLEDAVGTGGSVDSRITAAVNSEISRAQAAEQLLQEQYNALTQSDIIVGALPSSGTKNKIYRVPGTNSYADYMWNGSSFVKMAQYDNATDDVPTSGSNNLVKSGGVYDVAGSYKICDDYVKIITDKNNCILYAIKSNGDFVFGAGVPEQLKSYIATSLNAKVDKDEGKELILSQYIQEIENDDFIRLVIDDNNRILYGVKRNGDFCFGGMPEQISKEFESLENQITDIKNIKHNSANRQEAILLRKNISDNFPYYLAVDETDPQSFNVSSYYDERIRSINPSDNKLIFVTDTHWNIYGDLCGVMNENDLMAYVKKRLDITKVVFGGDANGENFTKYKADVIWKKYFNSTLSAFGKDFIPVIGDHDNNTFTSPSITDEFKRDNFYDFTHLTNIALEQIQSEAVFDDELINKVDTLYSEETAEMKAEIKAWLRTHYYVDDNINKVRYIVLFSGTPQDKSWLQTFMHVVRSQSCNLLVQFDFIAKALMTLPEGYSVVLSTHKIVDCKMIEIINDGNVIYRGSLTVEQAIAMGKIQPGDITEQTIIHTFRAMESASDSEDKAAAEGQSIVDYAYNLYLNMMLSAFKKKRMVTIRNYQTASNLTKLYSTGNHIYNFVDAPTASKIFGLCGHHHCDNSYLTGTVDDEYRSIYYQPGITPVPDDAILWLQFNTANMKRNHPTNQELENRGDGPDATGAPMEENTITETSFDVITWNEDNIACTRFGGGLRQNRIYNY